MRTTRLLVGVLLLGLLIGACGGSSDNASTATTASGAPQSTSLALPADVAALATAFDADAGQRRLLLLLSPT